MALASAIDRKRAIATRFTVLDGDSYGDGVKSMWLRRSAVEALATFLAGSPVERVSLLLDEREGVTVQETGVLYGPQMARVAPAAEPMDEARVMARAACCPSLERARLVAWVRFPDGRRRDLHNYMPTLKALVDGLVDAGLLPDDDARRLQGPDMRLDPRHTSKRMGIPMCSIRFTVMPFEENEEDPE